jgi:hypothetical protein
MLIWTTYLMSDFLDEDLFDDNELDQIADSENIVFI